MWQYMQTCNNQNLNLSVDNLYLKFNKKNMTIYANNTKKLHKQGTTTHANSTAYHTCIQNLSSVNFNNEEIKIMKLGTSYAFKKNQNSLLRNSSLTQGMQSDTWVQNFVMPTEYWLPRK